LKISEVEKPKSKDWLLHSCGNYILVKNVYCPFCKRFNESTNAENCPTCGHKLNEPVDEIVGEPKPPVEDPPA